MVTPYALYLGFLVVLSAERGAELVRSRRNAAWALSQGGVEVGQGHYPVMAALHTGFHLACAVEPIALQREFPGLLGWTCLALVVLTQALRAWAISTLGQRWNTRVIVLPDAEPVTGGPYRYLKHPNYVAVVLELAAVPLVFGNVVTAVTFSLANAALLVVRIRAEEQALGPKWQQAFAGRARFLPGRT